MEKLFLHLQAAEQNLVLFKDELDKLSSPSEKLREILESYGQLRSELAKRKRKILDWLIEITALVGKTQYDYRPPGVFRSFAKYRFTLQKDTNVPYDGVVVSTYEQDGQYHPVITNGLQLLDPQNSHLFLALVRQVVIAIRELREDTYRDALDVKKIRVLIGGLQSFLKKQ